MTRSTNLCQPWPWSATEEVANLLAPSKGDSTAQHYTRWGIHIYIYICIYIYVNLYLCVYIHRQRERKTERDEEREKDALEFGPSKAGIM